MIATRLSQFYLYRYVANVKGHARIEIFFVNKHGLLKIISISSSRHLFFQIFLEDFSVLTKPLTGEDKHYHSYIVTAGVSNNKHKGGGGGGGGGATLSWFLKMEGCF